MTAPIIHINKNDIELIYAMIKYIKNGNIFAIASINCYAHDCNCAEVKRKAIYSPKYKI